jgi:pyruvate kinase
MSHTSHDLLKELVQTIRLVEEKSGRPIGILADMQGPKLRVGKFEGDKANLEDGTSFTLDDQDILGNAERVQLPHPEIFASLEIGHRLLLDDGKIELVCTAKTNNRIETKIVVGGTLSNRKGVSLPDTLLPVGALTAKDRLDLDAALAQDVDWIALSFIQRPEDIIEARDIVRGRAGLLAKIEKPQAVECIDSILMHADAIMVARGDLGVEMPLEKVPAIQKKLTRLARRYGRPVVVATQMLESMIQSPVPTRAEVSDVATAVFEGADAIMLSAETAAGEHPLEAVAVMNRIAEEIERDPLYATILEAQRAEPEATGADAISQAARQIAETLHLPAIICYTSTGATGLRAARERPRTRILTLSPSLKAGRKMGLVWGIHSVQTEDARDMDDMVDRACRIAFREGFARPGDRVIVTAGLPFGTPGSTNNLRIAYVGENKADLF